MCYRIGNVTSSDAHVMSRTNENLSVILLRKIDNLVERCDITVLQNKRTYCTTTREFMNIA